MKTLITACLLVALVTIAHSASLPEQDEMQDTRRQNKLEIQTREKRELTRPDGLETSKRSKRQVPQCTEFCRLGQLSGPYWCCPLCGTECP